MFLSQKVSPEILNKKGKSLKSLFSGVCKTGKNAFERNRTDQSGNLLANGIYFLQIEVLDKRYFKKILLLK